MRKRIILLLSLLLLLIFAITVNAGIDSNKRASTGDVTYKVPSTSRTTKVGYDTLRVYLDLIPKQGQSYRVSFDTSEVTRGSERNSEAYIRKDQIVDRLMSEHGLSLYKSMDIVNSIVFDEGDIKTSAKILVFREANKGEYRRGIYTELLLFDTENKIEDGPGVTAAKWFRGTIHLADMHAWFNIDVLSRLRAEADLNLRNFAVSNMNPSFLQRGKQYTVNFKVNSTFQNYVNNRNLKISIKSLDGNKNPISELEKQDNVINIPPQSSYTYPDQYSKPSVPFMISDDLNIQYIAVLIKLETSADEGDFNGGNDWNNILRSNWEYMNDPNLGIIIPVETVLASKDSHMKLVASLEEFNEQELSKKEFLIDPNDYVGDEETPLKIKSGYGIPVTAEIQGFIYRPQECCCSKSRYDSFQINSTDIQITSELDSFWKQYARPGIEILERMFLGKDTARATLKKQQDGNIKYYPLGKRKIYTNPSQPDGDYMITVTAKTNVTWREFVLHHVKHTHTSSCSKNCSKCCDDYYTEVWHENEVLTDTTDLNVKIQDSMYDDDHTIITR